MPIILNAFAVDILRKLRWEHIDFTAMNASPPAISPAAPLFIYACVLRDIVYHLLFESLRKYSLQKYCIYERKNSGKT